MNDISSLMKLGEIASKVHCDPNDRLPPEPGADDVASDWNPANTPFVARQQVAPNTNIDDLISNVDNILASQPTKATPVQMPPSPSRLLEKAEAYKKFVNGLVSDNSSLEVKVCLKTVLSAFDALFAKHI